MMGSSPNTKFGIGCQICFCEYNAKNKRPRCEYNAKNKRPRCLPCGHSFCSSCISKDIQGMKLSCPNCRQEHQATSISDFPINYELERVMQEGPDSSQSKVEKASMPTGKTTNSVTTKLLSMKNDMDSSVKVIGTRGLETCSQLYQYKSNLDKWQGQHEEDLTKHKVIVRQHEDVIQSIKKEKDKIDEAIAEGDKEEQKLKTAENNLTVASQAHDIVPAIVEVDLCCVNFEKWTQRMHQCFPDSELVTQSQKLKERSKEGLLKLLEPLGKDGGTAVLTERPSSAATSITTKIQHQEYVVAAAAAASSDATEMSCEETGEVEDTTLCPSIEEQVKRALDSVLVRPMSQSVKKHQFVQTQAATATLEVQDLVNMTPYAKMLLESGRVYAVKKDWRKLRYARITLKNKKLFLHVLRKMDTVSDDIISLQFDDVLRLFNNHTEGLVGGASSSSSSYSSRLAFMELGREENEGRKSLGRVLFRLSSPQDDDDDVTPLARQFVLHCTGEKGTSLIDCVVGKFGWEFYFNRCKAIKEWISEGQLLRLDWEEEVDKEVYKRSPVVRGELRAYVFNGDEIGYEIFANDFDYDRYRSFGVFGKVEEGMDIVSSLFSSRPFGASVLDCGIVLPL